MELRCVRQTSPSQRGPQQAPAGLPMRICAGWKKTYRPALFQCWTLMKNCSILSLKCPRCNSPSPPFTEKKICCSFFLIKYSQCDLERNDFCNFHIKIVAIFPKCTVVLGIFCLNQNISSIFFWKNVICKIISVF